MTKILVMSRHGDVTWIGVRMIRLNHQYYATWHSYCRTMRPYAHKKSPEVTMDERGYVTQALFDRLRDDGVAFRVLNEDVEIAVPRDILADMPRRVARFAQDFDLALVQLGRAEPQSWQLLLAWSDDIGRPSFLPIRVIADYCRAGRRLLRAEELLPGAPDALFIYGLLEAVEQGAIDEARAAGLSGQWAADPRGAIERVGRYWRTRRDIRLIAQAAKHGGWDAVRAELPRLRRALRRAVWPEAFPLASKLGVFLENLMHPVAARVAFVGPESTQLRERVERDLAPAAISTVAPGKARGAEIGVAVDPPDGLRHRFQELITVDKAQALPAAAAQVERAVLRWLECRVERRHPDAVVGGNPLAARLLQFARRHRVPGLSDFMETLLNCSIACQVRSPILMPHPYGIVIHRNAVLGSRVTLMHQVTIGAKRPADPAAPVIEDNVFVGAGARILGAVRVGRGATVGANAVVTLDVPSHCTVVGVNRILGGAAVVRQRQADHAAVVNT
jgi:serine O-acetyltransferase